MARAKAKAKGLSCPSIPRKPYTPMLNGKFVKARDSQHYWGFPEPRFNLESRTMVPGFELLIIYNNKLPELKEEDTNWVPTDWADYMDPDAMTRLLDEERGEAPSDDDEGSNIKSDSSSDNNNSDNGDDEDDSNRGSETNNSEDYYYDGHREDDAEAEPIDMENGAKSKEYELENVLEATGDEVKEADNIDYDDYPYGRPSD
ncbi:secreted acidic protein 1A-like [Quercus lobata]|uniref:secreted acidic protein 1A-like n=1 Tax=Quercus lobata TaxID=97700 RepID=UPI0012482C7A|nr:secreted acidic protein 1A-like [Quercus lobata]